MNPDGTHSTVHGSVIVNPDGTHSTMHGPVTVKPDSSQIFLPQNHSDESNRIESLKREQLYGPKAKLRRSKNNP